MAACLAPTRTDAITVAVDYAYDAGNFFGAGNPQGPTAGAAARAAIEAAAHYYSNILADSFSPIAVPPQFRSAVSDGVVDWQWTRSFSHPATGSLVMLTQTTPGPSVAADHYIVYAGARNLFGAGLGGPGARAWSYSATGTFTLAEIQQITAITDAFKNQVDHRGETSGFANWGGSISFDAVPPAPWHYDHTTAPPLGATDFYTVALHELAHTLGFGASNEWEHFVASLAFHGPVARAGYGGSPVPLTDAGHWASGLTSVVYGGATPQPPLMSAVAPHGIRAHFTKLDAAAMKDIGWTVVPEPSGEVMLALAVIASGAVAPRRFGAMAASSS